MPKYYQDPSIRKFFLRGQPLSFSKGEVAAGGAPSPDGMYYIDTGYIKAYSINDSGEQQVHFVYGHGELFPLAWAYTGVHPEALFYEALSDTVLWRISRHAFTRYVTEDPGGGYAMAVQMAYQFQFFSDRLDNLEYKRASERIAYRLLFLVNRFGVKYMNGVAIDAPVTHDLIASTVNLARETVSREFEYLERQGIVGHKGSHILVIDIDRLARRLSEPSNLSNWRLRP